MSRRSPLYPAGAYALLVVYASLYPLTGWHDSGASPVEFLSAGWPRYTTGFDIATNVLAYLPLGLTGYVALRQSLGKVAASLLAALLCCALSLGMEMAQTFLPTRVPSNLDLAANTLGAIIGIVVGTRWEHLLDSHVWRDRRRRVLRSGDDAAMGAILLLIWLFAQLSPESLLFGSGNLRQLLDIPTEEPFLVERFVQIETVITAAGLLAAGLLARLLLLAPTPRHVVIASLALLGGALLLRALAHALLMSPASALIWMTPGSLAGLLLGLVLLAAASATRVAVQRAIAALALLIATAMVNLAPENPYLANTLEVWNQGHFLNFNGLTRLVCSIWPFLALPWLMLYDPHDTDQQSD